MKISAIIFTIFTLLAVNENSCDRRCPAEYSWKCDSSGKCECGWISP